MKYAAVTFVDGIKNQVLLTLDSSIRQDLAREIGQSLSHQYRTVVQIFMFDERVLTVSANSYREAVQ